MKQQYKGYTIRSSGKLLYKVIEPMGERPFFTRFVSVEAAMVGINLRFEDDRVMTPQEHTIVHPPTTR